MKLSVVEGIAQRHAEHINNKGELIVVCDIIHEKQMPWLHNTRSGHIIVLKIFWRKAAVLMITICSPNGFAC